MSAALLLGCPMGPSTEDGSSGGGTATAAPFWKRRLGLAIPGAKVLGVKVGTAIVLVWDSPDGVA